MKDSRMFLLSLELCKIDLQETLLPITLQTLLHFQHILPRSSRKIQIAGWLMGGSEEGRRLEDPTLEVSNPLPDAGLESELGCPVLPLTVPTPSLWSSNIKESPSADPAKLLPIMLLAHNPGHLNTRFLADGAFGGRFRECVLDKGSKSLRAGFESSSVLSLLWAWRSRCELSASRSSLRPCLPITVDSTSLEL